MRKSLFLRALRNSTAAKEMLEGRGLGGRGQLCSIGAGLDEGMADSRVSGLESSERRNDVVEASLARPEVPGAGRNFPLVDIPKG